MISNEELWYWHQQLEAMEKSGLSGKQFCVQNNIDYKKFTNRIYRIRYKMNGNPSLYQKRVELGRKFLLSGIPITEFSRKNHVNRFHVSEAATHLRYRDILDEMIEAKEKDKMNFIEVPITLQEPAVISPKPEYAQVMKKQNDVELIISAGVKVVVSPEVGADKLIRIIELLKDL